MTSILSGKSYYLNSDTSVYMGKELLSQSDGMIFYFNDDHTIKNYTNLFKFKKLDNDIRIIEGSMDYKFDYYVTSSMNDLGAIKYSAHIVDENGEVITPDSTCFKNDEPWAFVDFHLIDKVTNKDVVKTRRISRLGTFNLRTNVVVDGKIYVLDNDGYVVKNDIFINGYGNTYYITASDKNGVEISNHGGSQIITINKIDYILLDCTIANDNIASVNNKYYYADYDGKIIKNKRKGK